MCPPDDNKKLLRIFFDFKHSIPSAVANFGTKTVKRAAGGMYKRQLVARKVGPTDDDLNLNNRSVERCRKEGIMNEEYSERHV